MPDTTSLPTVYLVQQFHWRVHDHYTHTEQLEPGDPRGDVRENPHRQGQFELVTWWRSPDESGVPVRAFADLDRADAYCREQEQARRARCNPFRYGWGMDSRTSLDEGRLRDWLLDAGLTPPGHEGEENPEVVRASWCDWWHKHRDSVSPKQQQAL